MKGAVVVLFLAAVVCVNAFDKQTFMALGQKCKAESNTPDEDVKKIMMKQAPSSNEAKCMMACIFKNMGIMTQDGKFDPEGNMKAAEKAFSGDESKMQRAKKFVELCKDKIDAAADNGDGCERAATMFQCAMEKGKELGYDKEE